MQVRGTLLYKGVRHAHSALSTPQFRKQQKGCIKSRSKWPQLCGIPHLICLPESTPKSLAYISVILSVTLPPRWEPSVAAWTCTDFTRLYTHLITHFTPALVYSVPQTQTPTSILNVTPCILPSPPPHHTHAHTHTTHTQPCYDSTDILIQVKNQGEVGWKILTEKFLQIAVSLPI